MVERPFLCRLKSSGPGSRKAKALGTPEGLAASHSGTRKYLATRDDESQQFQLRPDIAFIDDYGVLQMIADAKWKLLNEADRKPGISSSDMYQLYAYAGRYKVDNLQLIYPVQAGLLHQYNHTLQGSNAPKLAVKRLR
ncbi:5-methylcytosine restriction system specificity protein McrC [Pseudescherichia sp.]|jgi:5-methylcytosine-specific restriction enzyme subunit McrC|uniref:5-methylcytosine restriction system specificity protein McrC n=1 Tax=Pseudescherichia sp. TaxID=2055881 RepID=UPI00289BF917|nr:hypothetical protein [Pseudescherichia sp.]